MSEEVQSEMTLKDKVVSAIKSVYDPEIPVDVYELGLIYEVQVYPVNNVFIKMTLTSPSCPSAETIPSEVELKVKAVEEVNKGHSRFESGRVSDEGQVLNLLY